MTRSPYGGKGLARDTRVRWALEKVGQPYEVRPASFKALKEPEHRARHPFGQITTYDEGDLVLFESGAIVLHIAETHAGLLPDYANGRERAIDRRFAALNTVEPPILELPNAVLLESDEPWNEARLPLVKDRLRDRLVDLSARLGRGLAPTWLTTLEKKGKKREQFLIKKKSPPLRRSPRCSSRLNVSFLSAFGISAVLVSPFEEAHRNGGKREGAQDARVYEVEHLRRGDLGDSPHKRIRNSSSSQKKEPPRNAVAMTAPLRRPRLTRNSPPQSVRCRSPIAPSLLNTARLRG